MRKPGFGESLDLKKAIFYFPLMPYCLAGCDNARCHVHSIHVWKEGVRWWKDVQDCHLGCRETKAPGGTAVRSRRDVEPCSCHAPSEVPYSLASCYPCSSGLQIFPYFPLPLLVTAEPQRMLMPYSFLWNMNKKLCSKFCLGGSFTPLIRKNSGFAWGFVVWFVAGLQWRASSHPPSRLNYLWMFHRDQTCQKIIKPNARRLPYLAVVAVVLADRWESRI